MTSKLDQRRLGDGARAASLPEPETAADIRHQLSSLHDAIAAMQSLDDLGSREANERAWNDMLALQERYKALEARLNEMEPSS